MSLGERTDPYGRSRFMVEIDRLIVGGFTEVTGLEASNAVSSESSSPGFLQRIASLVFGRQTRGSSDESNEAPRLRLTRGVTDNTELWSWMREGLDGKRSPRNGRVILQDARGMEVVKWELTGLEPVAYHGPELLAESPGVATETYELRYQSIERSVDI